MARLSGDAHAMLGVDLVREEYRKGTQLQLGAGATNNHQAMFARSVLTISSLVVNRQSQEILSASAPIPQQSERITTSPILGFPAVSESQVVRRVSRVRKSPDC